MRLAPRELVLLLSFLILVIAGGLGVGLHLVGNWSRTAALERDQAELALLEAELALADHDTWLQRRQWLDQQLPALVTVGDADSELLQVTAGAAAQRGARMATPALLEPVVNSELHAARVSFQLHGDLESVMGTLHELVQPHQFREIELLRLEADPSGPAEVLAQVRLRGYYRRADTARRAPSPAADTVPDSVPAAATAPEASPQAGEDAPAPPPTSPQPDRGD